MDDSNKPPFNPALSELSRYLRDFSSNAEIVLWNRLKDKALEYEFTWQHPINDYIVTFFCEEKKLAIDIESDAHTHPDAYFAAVRKENDLKEYKIRLIRVTEDEVLKSIDVVVEKIRERLK